MLKPLLDFPMQIYELFCLLYKNKPAERIHRLIIHGCIFKRKGQPESCPVISIRKTELLCDNTCHFKHFV